MKISTRDAKANYLAAMPKIESEAELIAEGYKLHHTSWFKGYVSRKKETIISSYKGKFGTGYTVSWNDGRSTQYSRVEYWIK